MEVWACNASCLLGQARPEWLCNGKERGFVGGPVYALDLTQLITL